MVSLAEANLQLDELKTKIAGVNMSYHEIRMVEISIVRIASALERMTGSKEVSRAVSSLNRIITTLRLMQVTMRALELASGPVGWAYAATTMIGAAFSGVDLAMSLGG